jgi:hypothetical protein
VSRITITWHAIMDNNTCPICVVLNGYTWVFEAGADVLTDGLWHPQFGMVWSLALGSAAHGHQRYNCRCHITPEIDVEDVLAKCVFLREEAQAASEPYIPWRGGELFV